MNNSKELVAGNAKHTKFSMAITTKGYQNLIKNTLGDANRAKRFVSAITSAVAVNEQLQACEASTILAGALLGESLNLSPSPQLGQYYLVPFKSKAKYDRQGNLIEPECQKAQFILGYKGYLQLAMRSGQLKKINVIEIKEGELVKFDALNEEIECKLIDDFDERESAETIGYYAFFELTNGFRKSMYWSKEKMMSHADKFSPAFSKEKFIELEEGKIAEKDMWRYSSFWYKNFDEMARKTMLRQLISKGGCPMSTEMITAFESDNQLAELDDDNEIAVAPVQPTEEQQEEVVVQKKVEEVSMDEI